MKQAGYSAITVALAALLLQACTTPTYYPPRPERYPPQSAPYPPVVEEGSPAPESYPSSRPVPVPAAPEPVAPSTPVQKPAVVALLDTAEQQANAGDLESAAASLERAIRIDPRNPVLWYHLATVRLSQGDAEVAEQFAMKSNSLAAGFTEQQRRNWELIARARRARQDTAGARAAEQRARELAGR